jgi:2-oxoglutarate dehydrogenase E1 component
MEDAYKASKTCKYAVEDWLNPTWEAIREPTQYGLVKDTGVDLAELTRIGERIATLPAGEKFHPSVVKIFNERLKSIQTGNGIDWGTAEALAFASLINEGYHVRLSGQDVERGTFSHRHAHVFYQDKDGCYVPINSVVPDASQTRNFIASCSHLSEYAVLGFEYGYATTNPNTLCLWEAQFGDFANGAQIMIDTMVTSGETKWNIANGLVMLLPHGYDGNGPEHSSSRVERFLQLSDANDTPPTEDEPEREIMERTNMVVVNCSTASQYFHILRSQMRRNFRKPLIVVAPKKLLKFRAAQSSIDEFKTGLRFKRALDDDHETLVADEKVRKVIYCSGQVYYDLDAARKKRGIDDVAIVRVEQLAPFPFRSLRPTAERFVNAEQVWAQEEPKNAGGW